MMGIAKPPTGLLASASTTNISNPSMLVLGHTTATLIWRSVRLGLVPMPAATITPKAIQCVHRRDDIANADMGFLGCQLTDAGLVSSTGTDGERHGLLLPSGRVLPLDVMVTSKAQAHRMRGVRTHLLSTPACQTPLYVIGEHVAVVSPELCFVQACLQDRMLPNLELAMEWMGVYALGNEVVPWCVDVSPLLDQDECARVLGLLRRVPGKRVAARALSRVRGGSASPRETACFLVLTLPQSMGGFNLPMPEINSRIDVEGTPAARFSKDRFYLADFLWASAYLIVEYDGRDDHELTPSDIQRDKDRRSVLAAMGYTVIVITRHDLRSEEALSMKVAQIAQRLHVEVPSFEGRNLIAHRQLLRWFFGGKHDYLPLGFGIR